MTDALRYNDGKPELHYLDTWYNAQCEVAQVCMKGAEKYERGNYLKGQPYSQLISAAYRHLGKFGDCRQPDREPESGRHHVAHAIWNLLQLLELDLTEVRKPKPRDDRLRPPPKVREKESDPWHWLPSRIAAEYLEAHYCQSGETYEQRVAKLKEEVENLMKGDLTEDPGESSSTKSGPGGPP